MTTIAYDGTSIAADGQRTWGTELRGSKHKKLIVQNGKIYAFTGTAAMFPVMVDWHASGADAAVFPPGINKDAEWTLIVVDHAGLGKFTNTCPYIERFDPPIAFGSGGDFAMGAMLAGAEAGRAVKLAASICIYTGGEIQVVNVSQALTCQQLGEFPRSDSVTGSQITQIAAE